jgi:hypothetical protein
MAKVWKIGIRGSLTFKIVCTNQKLRKELIDAKKIIKKMNMFDSSKVTGFIEAAYVQGIKDGKSQEELEKPKKKKAKKKLLASTH